MKNTYRQLTPCDYMILQSYKQSISGLGNYLGLGYEVILHSLDNLEHSVIKIINGHYSGRKEGAPITDFALSMLKKIEENHDYSAITYFNKNRNGSILKSTTIPILGESNHIIGLICINFYTDTPLHHLLSNLTDISTLNHDVLNSQEHFAENIDDVIISTLKTVKEQVLNDYGISTQNRNKKIILLLYEKGIFNIKDAVTTVAELLNISKNTVYMHLRNIKA